MIIKTPINIKEWFKKDTKTKIIILAGIAGMLLILISSFDFGAQKEGKNNGENSTENTNISMEEYREKLEERLSHLISQVDGVGNAEVMLTIESGMENVYIKEEKQQVDRVEENEQEINNRSEYSNNSEYNYVFVNGDKEPLLQTQIVPKVMGVVVVCDGADNILVQESVINVVTTALNISTTKVCVVKINSNTQNQEGN